MIKKENYIIVSDCGTSSTKSMIFNSNGDSIMNISLKTNFIHPCPTFLEQDTNEVYKNVVNGIRQLIKETDIDVKKVVAIAIGGQMGSLICIDEKFRPIHNMVSWMDNRIAYNAEELIKKNSNMISNISGSCYRMHSDKILWWKYEKPEIYNKISKFVPAPAYVTGRLIGFESADDAFIEPGYLVYSGLNDANTLNWSDKICNLLDIDIKKLPKIVDPFKIVGKLSKEGAADCNLPSGIPIIAGAGDHTAAALGAGIVENGMSYEMSGTSNVFGMCTPSFVVDNILSSIKSVLPNKWYTFGTLTGGASLQWFIDNFIYKVNPSFKNTSEKNIYNNLSNLASNIQLGCDNLFFMPHLAGRTCPIETNFRGIFVGFSWGHQIAHFYRAILESVAFEYLIFLDRLQNLYKNKLKIKNVILIGANSSQDNFWSQIKADVLGIPILQINQKECCLMGLSIIAGVGIGLYDDPLSEIKKNIQVIKTIVPNIKNNKIYTEICKKYEILLNKFSNFYNI